MWPHQPIPTLHIKGNNRKQRETRPLQSPRSRPHQPTPTPHMKGDNRRQRETRPLQNPYADHTNQHPPPHKGRQPETTGDKTTSEAKKPTTPTNTKAARSKVALRTPTVNCLGKKKSKLTDWLSRHELFESTKLHWTYCTTWADVNIFSTPIYLKRVLRSQDLVKMEMSLTTKYVSFLFNPVVVFNSQVWKQSASGSLTEIDTTKKKPGKRFRLWDNKWTKCSAAPGSPQRKRQFRHVLHPKADFLFAGTDE